MSYFVRKMLEFYIWCQLFSDVVCILIHAMELYCMITFCSYRSDVAEIEPALELLNTHGADFDMVEVRSYALIITVLIIIVKYHVSRNIDSDFNLVDHFSVIKLKFAISYNLPLAI